MSLLPARLVFVAFIGLCGLITYNALYLQDVRGGAGRLTASNDEGAVETPSDKHTTSKTANAPEAQVDSTVTGAAPAKAPVQEASSALVTAVQRELSVRGYDVGDGDGILTPETEDAIRKYELAHGLVETGTPSDELLRHIVLGESLGDIGMAPSTGGQGSSVATPPGDMVRAVQQTLADLGYAPGPVDGMMGRNTADAIRQFQKDRKLAETGEISPTLLQEMERVSGRRFAGGSTYR
ncbi:putative peptidoglycan binding domain protein [Methyloligella halotolerans]|uniref:Putative peptidoglycan binding domain protein n=1 Tax=Methyloligella halotolerans TaxID=1177755 RepID=A0A1E2RXM7_9HYPH|nr:peptidoglycan-binding protein [Methyloligella halotolerans]ODA66865.1 putative peptidoglycan binding domain protein [Methyloligella halotolerans]